MLSRIIGLVGLLIMIGCGVAFAQGTQTPAAPPAAGSAATAPAGKTASVPDEVAWSRFSGWKRYHANCSVCHGPDGLGGTFAPSLVGSLKSIDHDQFLETVVNGKENAQLAMPSFGADPNVMCYIEDIYVYLKARADGEMDRGRPTNQPAKPKAFAEAETACMGS